MTVSDRLVALAHPVAVAALAVGVQLPVFDRSMSLMDEGHILQFADIVHRGGELYRDANLLPLPGAFYLLAVAFDWFGPSVRVARWIVVIEFAVLAVLVFLLMQRMLSTRWAWRSVGVLIVYKIWAFPHWLMYSYSTTALTLLALGLVALVRFLDEGRWPSLALAGLATGLGVLCKQDYGAAVWVGTNAVLAIAVRARATAPAGPTAVFVGFNAPAVAVGAATALHFLRQGLFTEMLQQTLLNHLKGIASFAYTSLPPLLPLLEPDPMLRTPFGIGTYTPSILFTVDWELWQGSAFYAGVGWDLAVKLFFYAPYAIVFAGGLRLWWTRTALDDPLRRRPWIRELALFAFAASLVLALNKPVDYVHVAVLYWPLLLLLLVYAQSLVAKRRRLAALLRVASLVPALAIGAYSARLVWGIATTFDTPLRGERAGIRIEARDEAVIGGVVDYVRAHSRPGERVAVLPYFPLVSFLARRDAPDPAIYTFWPVAYVPDREARIRAAIEASGVDFVVYHFTQWPQLPTMDVYAPELFAWLVREYEMETIFGDASWGYQLAVLRRAPESDGGVALLEADAANARVAIRQGGRARPVADARRAEFVRTALWPFRTAVALRPSSGERSSVLAIPLEVPAQGARLRTAIGTHPSHWFRFPPSDVLFEIRVSDGEDSELLFSETLAPHRDPAQRGWRDVEVGLGSWAGRRVELELLTRASSPRGEVLEMGGWEPPRLYPAPHSATAEDVD